MSVIRYLTDMKGQYGMIADQGNMLLGYDLRGANVGYYDKRSTHTYDMSGNITAYKTDALISLIQAANAEKGYR